MNKELGMTTQERAADVHVGSTKDQKEKGGWGEGRELRKMYSFQEASILVEEKLTTNVKLNEQIFVSSFCHFLHLLQFRAQIPQRPKQDQQDL